MADEKLGTDVRRAQIARAALEVAAAKGLRALSMAAIARRVGLVPSALYRHFKNKDELLDGVVEAIRGALMANLAEARTREGPALERLHRLLQRHVKLIRENGFFPRVVLAEEFYHGRPERRAKVLGALQAYLDGIRALVVEGQRQGGIRSDLDAATVAPMLLGLIQPAVLMWHLSDGGYDVTRQVERSWQILRRVLSTESE